VNDSRRIYALDEDLQLVIENTSLDGVRWSDVELPFRSFAITLEAPLEFFGKEYSVLLWSPRYPGKPTLTLIGDHMSQYRQLTSEFKGQMSKALFQSDHISLLHKLDAGADYVIGSTEVLSFSPAVMDDWEVLKLNPFSRDLIGADGRELQSSALRMLVGLAMYMKNLPNVTVTSFGPPRDPILEAMGVPEVKKPWKFNITNGMNPLTIDSVIKFSEEERRLIKNRQKQSLYELRCHFREGHWRRPRGLGNDPSARRTEWVRPTLVRRDRYESGEEPLGKAKARE
jgi:hypothetical protein